VHTGQQGRCAVRPIQDMSKNNFRVLNVRCHRPGTLWVRWRLTLLATH
jgi:hypothetical protein